MSLQVLFGFTGPQGAASFSWLPVPLHSRLPSQFPGWIHLSCDIKWFLSMVCRLLIVSVDARSRAKFMFFFLVAVLDTNERNLLSFVFPPNRMDTATFLIKAQ